MGVIYPDFRHRLGLRYPRADFSCLTDTILLFLKTLDLVVVSAVGAPTSPPNLTPLPDSGTKCALGKLYDCVIKLYNKGESKESAQVTCQSEAVAMRSSASYLGSVGMIHFTCACVSEVKHL